MVPLPLGQSMASVTGRSGYSLRPVSQMLTSARLVMLTLSRESRGRPPSVKSITSVGSGIDIDFLQDGDVSFACMLSIITEIGARINGMGRLMSVMATVAAVKRF